MDLQPSPAEPVAEITAIDRANPVARSAEVPRDAVDIGAWVARSDRLTEQSRTMQLVCPVEADIAAGRVPVPTPIGAVTGSG